VTGKPWSIDSRHASFEAADARRKELLKDIDGLFVKVKRYNSDGTFGVKTRLAKKDDPLKHKKKKKRKSTPGAKRSRVG
jgi:hypothetical protein